MYGIVSFDGFALHVHSWEIQVWMNKIVELVLPMIGQVYVSWIIHGTTSLLPSRLPTYSIISHFPFPCSSYYSLHALAISTQWTEAGQWINWFEKPALLYIATWAAGGLAGQEGEKEKEEGETPHPHQDQDTHLGCQPWAAGVWRPRQFLEHFKSGRLASWRLFAWCEEAGGLRATEETDSDRRRREEDGTSVCPKPPPVQQVPFCSCLCLFLCSCHCHCHCPCLFPLKREDVLNLTSVLPDFKGFNCLPVEYPC